MRAFTRTAAVALLVAFAMLQVATGATDGEPGDRGFVFFDGAYIDAPYRVEARGLAIYLNGLRITKPLEWPPLEDHLFDHDPGFPEGLTRDSTLEEALGVREPGGMLFDTAKQRYLFSHMSYDDAYRQMEEYYRALPCVKDLYPEDGLWVLESYGGERVRLVFGHANVRLLNEWYGPDGTGPPPLAGFEELVERRRARFEERLSKGDLFLLYSDGTERSFAERRAAVLLPEMLRVLESATTRDAKRDELYALGAVQRGDERHAHTLVREHRRTAALESRVASLRERIRTLLGDAALELSIRDLDLKARAAKQEMLDSGGPPDRDRAVAYSPDGSSVYGFCGYIYDGAFSGFDGEVAAVGDYVKDQDFYSTLNIYVDRGDEDSDAETATYDNLKQMRYSDLLYIAVHGGSTTGGGRLYFVLLESQNDIEEWAGHDAAIVASIDSDTDWPTGHPYYATATSGWATSNWKTLLDQSRAISILSCCYSHENGWAAACGGAVAFGYDVSCTGWGCEENNEMLLKRMNGTVGDGEHRKAYEAYNDMPSHHHQFRITPANAEATLAPTTEDHEPDDGALVDSEGAGFFQADTYCMAGVSADEALTFETDGDVEITNVHWVGTDRANRIEFDWEGTGEFEVTVTANADKIKSWGAALGGRHKLDGDGEAPNGDDYEFSFTSRPKSVLFVIDDTGSMGDEIASVRIALLALIDSFESSGERILYTLITFKDDVNYRGQTEDPDLIRAWVSALYATGGGPCPEESCDALLLGAAVAPNSEAWWMTDADVHGGWARLAYVRAVLWLSGVRLHSVIMGSCSYDALGRPIGETACGSNDPGGTYPRGDLRDQVNSYEAARYLSEGTGGLYFPVPSYQVQDATEICLKEMTRTAVACVYDCVGPASYDVPVDGSATEARFLVNLMTGWSPEITVRNPSGYEVSELDSGVTLMTAGYTEYLIVEPPALVSGTWSVDVGGSADEYVFRSALVTPLTFDYLGETSAAAGVPLDVIVDLEGGYPPPAFHMVTEDGATQIGLALYDDGAHDDGGPGDGRYGGPFTAADGATYRIKAAGGGSYCRMDPAKIFFGEMAATVSGDRYVTPGDTALHVFTVRNLSDQAQDYDIEFQTSMSWANLTGLPSVVSIEPDSSYVAYVEVLVPVTAFNGEADELTMSAAQQSDPLVSASAAVRTIAWSGPLIDEITPAELARGDVMEIVGESFGDDPGSGHHSTIENNVIMGGVQLVDASVLSWSPETIEVRIPHGLASGQHSVYVTAGGIASNPHGVTVVEAVFGLSDDNVFFYPNPYDPDTEVGKLSYCLSRDAELTATIYTSTGDPVVTLVDGESRVARARYLDTWDGKNDEGEAVANGVYFYVIESTGGEKAVGKLAVLR